MPRKKRCILGKLYRQGYREYTAEIGGFGSSDNDGWRHHHINILLVDIKGDDGLHLDHCWSRCRPRWSRVMRGDLVKFEAKVATYSGGYKLARFRNIRVIEKGCDRRCK
jgi:hypothetical protein